MKTNTSPSTVTCRGKLVLLAILAVACSLVAPMPCQAGTMKNVQATFAQSDAPGGTAGTIDGNYGLEGTMTIRFTGRTESSGIATITGIATVTSEQGTLIGVATILYDLGTGNFTAVETITGGTGRYAGATGILKFTGATVAGAYVGNMTGSISTP